MHAVDAKVVLQLLSRLLVGESPKFPITTLYIKSHFIESHFVEYVVYGPG